MKAGDVVNFGQPLDFDYTMYSKESIRLMLDALHLINVDQVDLLVAVEVLDYLHFEGKTVLSDFERRLSKSIVQALIGMKLPVSTQIALCFAISTTDNYDNSYELSVGSKLNKMTEFAKTIFEVNFDDEIDKSLIQRCVDKGLFDANYLQKSIDLELMALGRRINKEHQFSSVQTGIALTCGGNKKQRKLVEQLGAIKNADANMETCVIDTLDQLWVNGEKHLEGKIVKTATSGNLDCEQSTAYYATDDDDKIWSWGYNGVGQLGNGTTKTCDTPKIIKTLENKSVKSMSVYGNTVACVTHVNEAFVWGRCDAFGLGGEVRKPTKLDQCIEAISVGRNHAMMMEASCVFSIGGNSRGELGVGDFMTRVVWTKVEGLDGETIAAIQCGNQCSAILTDDSVFVMGRYLNGGKNVSVNIPRKVNLVNIVKISLRAEHILVLDNEGGVYAWGLNFDGRCGVDSDASHITEPTRVPIFSEYTVLDISAGEDQSIITVTK